jgi:hypothetical protein
LWLIVLFVWLDRGAKRPLVPTIVGSVAAVTLPLSLSIDQNTSTSGFQHINAVASSVWAGVDVAVASAGVGTTEGLLFMCLCALVVATLLMHRSAVRILPVVVLASFLLSADVAWYLAEREARVFGLSVVSTSRTWVDDRVGSGVSVTLVGAAAQCGQWEPAWNSMYMTEFFNGSVEQAVFVGLAPDDLPHSEGHVLRSGRIRLSGGEHLRADYVLAEPGIRFAARQVAQETSGALTLWEVRGVVKLHGIGSNVQFERAICQHPSRSEIS